MTSPESSSTFLNPDTYLNHLSPSDGRDFEISRNVTLVVLGVTIWDTLVYVLQDIRIIRRSPFQCVIVAFVLSRLSALGYVLLGTLERTRPFENARVHCIISSFCGVVLTTSSTFLFLRRVHAVYADSRCIRWAFSFLWFLFLAYECAVPFGIVPTYIPGTLYYRQTVMRPWIQGAGLLLLVFDTAVFVAISYKISTSHTGSDEKVSWSTLVSGKALPRLSRAILQGGQQYYLMTVGATIVVTVMLLLPSMPPPLKITLAIPILPFEGSMACRTFRNLWSHEFEPDYPDTNTITNMESGCTTVTISTSVTHTCS